MNPFALEEAGRVTLEVKVTTTFDHTTDNTYTVEVDIHTALPWKVTSGIRNVPIGIPVLLHGKEQPLPYDWQLTLPSGSTVTFEEQDPEFTPEEAGLYEVTVTDTTGDEDALVSLQIYAGTWQGVIVGQDKDGRPVADTYCTDCHDGGAQDYVADQFTPWAQTGHAEIFTNNLNSNDHYGESCFACHTVGFDLSADNGGMDDAVDYARFLRSKLLPTTGKNKWTRMLKRFKDSASLANIQCENCHGPQNSDELAESDAHRQLESSLTGLNARSSLSSDVCAVCHGEPLRHARFQQWQLSGHANYELAIEEGGSGNCSRCHTGNGFLAWLPILLGDATGVPEDPVTVTWEPHDVHPQTCVTCHDPHSIGTTSGNNTNATVRISDDTPPLIAGFTATGVGRGAICMTCHNSRRGLRNEDTFNTPKVQGDLARAPHGSAQTDVVMGQNAYLVYLGLIDPILGFPPGLPGGHAFLQDTCVTCHMEATPPPDILSYNQGGSNHTFFARNDICGECHKFDTGKSFQGAVQISLDTLQHKIEAAMLGLITERTQARETINLNDEAIIYRKNLRDVADIVFGGFRGQQAITVAFVDGTTVGPVRLSDVSVVKKVTVCHTRVTKARVTKAIRPSRVAAHLGHGDTLGACPGDAEPASLGDLYDFADPTLIKVGWNWGLVNNDGSLGIHNPFYVLAILDESINVLP